VVQVFVVIWNWPDDLLLGAAALEVGVTTHEKFNILPCRVKIQGLTLIGYA
jgi:hypothetical protein